LRCYSSTRTELTVTEVAQMLSLPKSNVSRLLRSMRDVGLLDSARDGRGYSPGVMLLGFGEVASAGRSLGMRAHAAVTRCPRCRAMRVLSRRGWASTWSA
jgi:DNA-binding IclR family transcriptional regulator